MCKPASMVLTKDKVFWSMNTDSHEGIIDEYKLHADGKRGPNILRVEIVPPNGDRTKPPSKWVFGYDQDVLPSWADAERDEKRTRAALREWKSKRVFVSGHHEIKSGHVYLCGNAKAVLWGTSSAELWDSSSAVLFGTSSAVSKSRNALIQHYVKGELQIEGWVRVSQPEGGEDE